MPSENRYVTVTEAAGLFEVPVATVVQAAESLSMPMRAEGFDTWTPKWSRLMTALKREQKKALTKANKQAKHKESTTVAIQRSRGGTPTALPPSYPELERAKVLSRYVVQSFETKQDADIARIQEQIVALQIKNDQLRNTLIPRDDVRRVLTELYSIESTELRFLGDRVGPTIASVADIERPEIVLKISGIITEEINHILAHIDDTFKKFLDGLETEER